MILDAQPDIEVVAEAENGQQAIDAVKAHRADVALLDVRMPVLDGLAAAGTICADTDCRVIMLTTFDLDDYVYAALRAGASGFLLKDLRRDDLIHAVRVVAGGEALLAPTVTRRMIAEFAAKRPVPGAVSQAQAAGLDQLTTRERETLVLLAQGRSNAEIAADFVVSEHTVKTHVSNVLSKLHLRDRIHAVVYAYESGLVTPGQ
jgi:DNA-binding NarL/FixJ family response regulator